MKIGPYRESINEIAKRILARKNVSRLVAFRAAKRLVKNFKRYNGRQAWTL